MLRETLPLECWERVIDSCNSIDYPQLFRTRRKAIYPSLRSCALTCRAFHPRSRLNLLLFVELDTEAQVDLLIRTLTELPFLADLVTGISHVSPGPIWSKTRRPYVPLARSPLPSLLRNCRSLRFPLFSSIHNVNYIHSLASFSYITTLAISISGHSISTLLHIIWSYPEICELSLDWPDRTPNWKPIPESYEMRLSKMRPPSACRNLERLTLHGTPPISLPPGIFGNSVSHLVISGLTKSHNDSKHWAFLSEFLRLQSIHLGFAMTETYLPSPSGFESDEVRKLSVVQLSLSNIRAYTALRSIEVEVLTNAYWPPSVRQGNSPPGDGSLYFVISRLEALELLFGGHIGDLLRQFPRLDTYEVRMYDTLDRETWWRNEIKTRMPNMLHAICLRLEPFGETTSTWSDPNLGGWLEDVPTSQRPISSEERNEVIVR